MRSRIISKIELLCSVDMLDEESERKREVIDDSKVFSKCLKKINLPITERGKFKLPVSKICLAQGPLRSRGLLDSQTAVLSKLAM